MGKQTLSRRTFLAMTGLGTAALLSGCYSTTPPNASPFSVGPYVGGQLILGEDFGTQGMPQTLTRHDISSGASSVPYNQVCQDGMLMDADLPTSVHAAVYYPHDEHATNHIQINTAGMFPVLLYAHGFRETVTACQTSFPISRDFTRSDFMLRHVASYGCVAVAPDLSWLPGGFPADDPAYLDTITYRANVIAQYYQYLSTLNKTVFANQLDLSRIVLVGHSTGGPSVTQAASSITATSAVQPLAFGLIAPVPIPSSANPTVSHLLVLKGTLDTLQGATPDAAYAGGAAPKTLVTIPGANHWGYTNLCGYDNSCSDAAVNDHAGTISGGGQQNTGAAYLAAMVRFYALGDTSARPYLSGDEMVEGLDYYGVTGIQIQSQGLPRLPPPIHP